MKNFKRIIILLVFPTLIISSSFSGCKELGSLTMSEGEVARGLKEALAIGAVNAVLATNQENGFYQNPLIKIPFPEEAQGAMNFMQNSGLLRPLLNEFVLRLNRAAEHAAEKAKPILADAITGITIQDAWGILRGGEGSATRYLKDRTHSSLVAAFRPDILNSLQAVGAQTAWAELTSAYNTIAQITPSLSPVNTDLAQYTAIKALDGLFSMVEQEENKIRKDPVARVTDLLKRVFAQQ
jgi:hypothetical protein